MRCAEQLGRRGGHIHRLHALGLEGKVVAGLEQGGIKEALQLWGLEGVDAVIRCEEGDDERDAQIRDRQVAKQQLGVVLAKRMRVRHVELAE